MNSLRFASGNRGKIQINFTHETHFSLSLAGMILCLENYPILFGLKQLGEEYDKPGDGLEKKIGGRGRDKWGRGRWKPWMKISKKNTRI